MSAFIKQLNIRYANLPKWQRHMVISGMGVVLITGVYFLLPENQEIKEMLNVMPNVAKPKQVEAQAAMPKTFPIQAMRDPFTPPPGFEKPDKLVTFTQSGNQLTTRNDLGRATSNDPDRGTLPILMGVVSGGDRHIAIINYNNVSRSYYPGQDIGPYKLAKVDANSVVVEGFGGRQVLALGR
ncbi:MAG: hypothetical protein K0R55_92 [Sporomusa sp.]|jgi:hypothetical protein|nr:hypothetical protein [Sporomusa sp.]